MLTDVIVNLELTKQKACLRIDETGSFCQTSVDRASDRGHLVAGYSFDDYCVGPETGLDVSLEVDEPVIGCDVKLCVYAFSAHAVCHMDLVMSIGNGNSDGLGVSEVAHRDVVQIDTEAYCHAEGVAHTVHLDDAVFGKNEGVVALGAVAVAGYVCYVAA